MQRWTAFLFAALLIVTLALVVRSTRDGRSGSDQPGPDAGASASVASAPSASAPPSGSAVAVLDMDAGAAAGSNEPPPPTTTSDAGTTLLSGETAPTLPADAPKSVVFGVILLQYKGAQGAPPTARSRDAALALAKQLAADAKQDFKAAVAKGDKGSTENAGKIQRNFLEPAPEYVLFSLAKDGVSEPVDTPRGFWIVKRVE
jgi:hypothetical protein